MLSVFLTLLLVGFVRRELVARNITPSEPLGYYAFLPTTRIQRDELVWLCESDVAHSLGAAHHFVDAGRDWPVHGCPESHLLLKNAWGLPGDRMAVTSAGVTRNGMLIADSIPLVKTSDGTKLPIADAVTVPLGMVWGGSTFERSYDSRYYGPARLVARALPVPAWIVDGGILVALAGAAWLLVSQGVRHGPR